MSLNPKQIRSHPQLYRIIKRQSEAFLHVNSERSRLASIFACQHRWLMAHAGLALYFENLRDPDKDELSASNFVRLALQHDITSRNTATSFLGEMLKYGIITRKLHPTDKRKRVMAPSEMTIGALSGWILIHLATLDALDEGDRQARYITSPECVAKLQPLIARRLLLHAGIRNPDPFFAHFMWMNSGFLITERLVLSVTSETLTDGRLPTSLASTSKLTAGFNLSRTHSARKMKEADEMGIIGWSGTRGRSSIWVSSQFVKAFLDMQAHKLAIINEAFGIVFEEQTLDPNSSVFTGLHLA
ncbi:hypothetical protein E2F50_18815 [Rhizobium deserti]|uniref:Uncharacterized protein n=1 Tax=Rhizobium deserti TaxID=2547961 RepID=A0A4R5UAB3_9HYPH|nr:hypothetical protein [Rhizobium deserti]TDK31728.1 hypothetical protein E2F50_18815 [Rhizobium deserti]